MTHGDDGDRNLLRHALRACVRRGGFTLSSGGTSDVYVDTRPVTMDGRLMWLLAHQVFLEAAQLLGTQGATGVDIVAGPALGAAPVVCAVSMYAAHWGTPVAGLLVRPPGRDHGADVSLFGAVPAPGSRAVVVEDVLTTGRSALRAVELLRDMGTEPACLVALVDRGGLEAVRGACPGLPASALFSLEDLL